VSSGLIVLLVCAGGYVALALYGKYRKLKDEFHEAREEERRTGA
jgi:hypothetical protein